MKIIKPLLNIRDLPIYMQLSMMYFVLSIVAGVLVAPYVVATTGAVLALAIISGFTVSTQVGSLLSVYLDDLSFKYLSKLVLIYETLFMLSMFIVYIDLTIWIYCRSILTVFQRILLGAWTPAYDNTLSEHAAKSKKYTFRSIQICERTWFSLSGIVAGALGTGLYLISDMASVHLSMAVNVICIALLYYTYYKYYRHM